jgi:hypothetical protein
MIKLRHTTNYFAAPVAKFNDVFRHNFVKNNLKLMSFWLKMRKTAKKFFCCGLQCKLSYENFPTNQKVWSPLIYCLCFCRKVLEIDSSLIERTLVIILMELKQSGRSWWRSWRRIWISFWRIGKKFFSRE